MAEEFKVPPRYFRAYADLSTKYGPEKTRFYIKRCIDAENAYATNPFNSEITLISCQKDVPKDVQDRVGIGIEGLLETVQANLRARNAKPKKFSLVGKIKDFFS
jgi:hypothetical protein